MNKPIEIVPNCPGNHKNRFRLKEIDAEFNRVKPINEDAKKMMVLFNQFCSDYQNEKWAQTTQDLIFMSHSISEKAIDFPQDFDVHPFIQVLFSCLEGRAPKSVVGASLGFLSNLSLNTTSFLVHSLISEGLLLHLQNILALRDSEFVAPALLCISNIATDFYQQVIKVLSIDTIRELLTSENPIIVQEVVHLFRVLIIICKEASQFKLYFECLLVLLEGQLSVELLETFTLLAVQPDIVRIMGKSENPFLFALSQADSFAGDEEIVAGFDLVSTIIDHYLYPINYDFSFPVSYIMSDNSRLRISALRLLTNALPTNPSLFSLVTSHLSDLEDAISNGKRIVKKEAAITLSNYVMIAGTGICDLYNDADAGVIPYLTNALSLDEIEVIDPVLRAIARMFDFDEENANERRSLRHFKEAGGLEIIENLSESDDPDISELVSGFSKLYLNN